MQVMLTLAIKQSANWSQVVGVAVLRPVSVGAPSLAALHRSEQPPVRARVRARVTSRQSSSGNLG